MKNAGIIGLGLIGGSMAKALKEKCGFDHIFAYDKDEKSLKDAKNTGVISDYSTDSYQIFADCSLVFICLPIDKIVSSANDLRGIVKKDCVVTDCGSVKSPIVYSIESDDDFIFIGGHPMAGSEKTGFAHSTAILFENAYYILTPLDKTPKNAISFLEEMTKNIGSLPIIMTPDDHDKAVASISHTPHIIASTLVNMAQSLDNGNFRGLAAGGFKDITRIASADPSLWQEICVNNREEILKTLQVFKNELSAFEHSLQNNHNESLENSFANAKSYRDSIVPSVSSNFGIQTYEIYTDIEDKIGSIATVSTLLSVNNISIKNIGIVNNREHEGGVLHILVDSQDSKNRAIDLLTKMNFVIYV